jgi:hypothetical protein
LKQQIDTSDNVWYGTYYRIFFRPALIIVL